MEKHKLAEQILLKVGTVVDATLIPAPCSTKNKDKARDPGMHSSKKGKQWYFGMKAHMGVDANSGLVHVVRGTSGHVSDISEGNTLVHGQKSIAFGDAGYQGIEKRTDTKSDLNLWMVRTKLMEVGT